MTAAGVTALPDGTFRHDWCGKSYRTEALAMRCTDAAPDAGLNARQMVLNRDTDLAQLHATQAALEALSMQYAGAVAVSTTDRQGLHAGVDQNAADTTTLKARVTTLEAAVTALTARVAALEGRVVETRMRSFAVPLLALGGTQTVNVVWRTPFTSAVYDVEVELLGVVVGNYTYTVTGKTTAGCTVAVKGVVAVAASTCLVQARRYG